MKASVRVLHRALVAELDRLERVVASPDLTPEQAMIATLEAQAIRDAEIVLRGRSKARRTT